MRSHTTPPARCPNCSAALRRTDGASAEYECGAGFDLCARRNVWTVAAMCEREPRALVGSIAAFIRALSLGLRPVAVLA